MDVLEEDLLYSVADLPANFQEVFIDRFQYFNWIQSECFTHLFRSDKNMVIGSPTGSGKTVLMELAILRVLDKFRDSSGKLNYKSGSTKMIYLAPTHALVHQKQSDWQRQFGSIGLNVLALTNSEVLVDLGKEIRNADIILTTPEKLDAITRKRKNLLMSFFADIALLLVDEVHILNDDRGSSLEAIVSRLKLVSQIPEMMSYDLPIARIRYVAVSATVPNIRDIGEWLQCPREAVKSYGDEMRPVKLKTSVLGYQPAKNNFMFERHLNHYLGEVIMRYGKGKSSIVFCASRNDSTVSAHAIREKNGNYFLHDQTQAEILLQESSRIEDPKLKALVPKGIAFHHAALCQNDRKIVEGLFLARHIVVLCSTSTLAYGVNLPAYLVVLKSTRYWSSKTSSYEEYDRSLCLQMAGRAGRPQFETEGQCVIMTERHNTDRYRNLIEGLEEIESHLLPSIREHLNNEIGLLTIRSLADCEVWLQSTFLGIRISLNPSCYANQMKLTCKHPDDLVREICKKAIADLKSLDMVELEDESDKVSQLEPGRILSQYYLKLETVKNFQDCKAHLSLEGALWLLSASSEFKQTVIRRAERRTLNALNAKGYLRFFVPQPEKADKALKSLKTPCQKIFLLIQEAFVAGTSTLDHSLRSEREEFLRTGPRIVAAAARYFLYSKQFAAAANCLILSKALQHRIWPDSPHQCRQITGVGQVISSRLEKGGLSTIDQLENASVQNIETAALQKYPFGSRIKSELKKLPPKIAITLQYLEGRSELELCLSFSDKDYQATTHGEAWILIGSTSTDKIIYSESLKFSEMPDPYLATIPISDILKSQTEPRANYVAAFITQKHFGRDVNKVVAVTKCETNAKRLKTHPTKNEGMPSIKRLLPSLKQEKNLQKDLTSSNKVNIPSKDKIRESKQFLERPLKQNGKTRTPPGLESKLTIPKRHDSSPSHLKQTLLKSLPTQVAIVKNDTARHVDHGNQESYRKDIGHQKESCSKTVLKHVLKNDISNAFKFDFNAVSNDKQVAPPESPKQEALRLTDKKEWENKPTGSRFFHGGTNEVVNLDCHYTKDLGIPRNVSAQTQTQSHANTQRKRKSHLYPSYETLDQPVGEIKNPFKQYLYMLQSDCYSMNALDANKSKSRPTNEGMPETVPLREISSMGGFFSNEDMF